jgi:CHAT domain-containing protein
MRSIFTTLLCNLLYFAVIAQPTGDIQKDTAQANVYFKEALQLTDKTQKIRNLEQAMLLYEQYPFQEKQLEIISRLAYAYHYDNDSLSSVYSAKAIDLAVLNMGNNLSKNLLYSHYNLLIINHLRNISLAIKHGEIALQMVDETSKDYFEITFLLVTNYIYNNDIKKAEALLTAVYDLINTPTWAHYLAPFYRGNMQVQLRKRNFEKAVFYGKQCLIENEKSQIYSVAEVGPIYVEIGLNVGESGSYEEGIQWVKDGIAYSKPTGTDLASYYANLARLHTMAKNIKASNDDYQKAVTIFSQDTIFNASILQILHHNISVNYYSIHDYSNALIHIKKSLAYVDNPYGKNEYANILNSMRKYDEALRLVQDAIIEMSTDFEDRDIYVNPSKYEVYTNDYWAALMLSNKAANLIARGILTENSTDIKQGIETGILFKDLWQRVLEKMVGFDQAKTIYSQQFQRIFDLLLVAAYNLAQIEEPNDLSSVFSVMEERKSKLLLETLTPSKLPDSLLAQQETLVNQLRTSEQQVDLTTKDSLDYYQTILFDANTQLETFLVMIDENYPKQASNFYNIQYATLAEIQSNLEKETVMIEYNLIKLFNKDYLYLYLISTSNAKMFVVPVPVDFSDKISQLNKLTKSPFLLQQANREQFITLSNELYQVLIEPIIQELDNKSKLIIIPEGELFYLPFEILLSTNDKKPFEDLDFLIKDFDITYQYSATIYQQLKSKPAIENKSLLAFAPVFEQGQSISTANRSLDFMVDSLYQSISNDKFIGLPNTKKEVETIAETIIKNKGIATVLLADKATKSQLQTNLKQPYQFIHLATHGLVNYKNPKLSALACYENSLKSSDDLLFANEIQMQDIQADLVVLSSCESGIGQLVKAEGLIALNRSFIYAGANNVMFSLWKVNDEYTSELMINFYKFYMEKEEYSAALRQAKLKLLQDPITANPRYWAAFVLIGK